MHRISTRWQPIIELGLPALTMLFGLQTLRMLLPLVVYHYGVQPGVSTVSMGLYALGVFLAAFLVAVVRRLLKPRPSLLFTTGGVSLLRLVEQFSTSPQLDLILTTVGTVLFLFFLPAYLGHVRGQRERGTGVYALGLLLGLTLDTALRSFFGTYDLSWQPSFLTGLIVLVLILVQLILLVQVARRESSPPTSDTTLLSSLPFLALGPFLFLQALVLQNVAQLTTLTGWPLALPFGLIGMGNALGLAMATILMTRQLWNWWPLALLFGLGLLAAMALHALGSWGTALGIVVGQVSGASLLTLILLQQGACTDRPGLWRTAIAHGLGMFLFVVLVFLYYATYDLGLPLDNVLLFYIAALMVGLCALGATVRLRVDVPLRIPDRPAIGVALALLLLPLALYIMWQEPRSVTGAGWPVRVMSYNLHHGFATDGWLGMEALAQTIERERPDVVAIQEVSRGWYIDGSLDMLTWLSQRLDMPYHYGPTLDPLIGNAILSRFPIVDHSSAKLPRSYIDWGYLWVQLDMGGDQELLVIVTQFHDGEADHEIRLRQSSALLEFWGGRSSAIILGDLNAWPHSPEMGLFYDAGLLDAFVELGRGDGYTKASNNPYERIDYIWYTPDLQASDFTISTGTASDHLGVAVTVTQ